MKVVQILPDLNGGGVERGTLEVAKALTDNGHQSWVISAGGRMVEELEQDGSQHLQWDLGRKNLLTFRHIWGLRRWLAEQQPDILHLRSRMPAWVAWLAWRGLPAATRPRLVTTVHGLYSVSAYSAVMCKGERVIAVSETVERYIAENYPTTDLNKVRRIYRGVAADAFPYGFQPSAEWLSAWQQQYPQLAGKRIITLPGRLTRLKGHHKFLDLIQGLVAQGLPVHGLIVGGEDPKRQEYATELKQRVAEENLSQWVTFTGARSDIRELFSQSDIVLSLSTKPESFGRTVLEALNLGVPVIGYDHGGVGEILAALYPSGRTPLNEAEPLLERVVAQLESGTKPAPVNRFSRAEMLDQTLNLYQELLSDSRRDSL